MPAHVMLATQTGGWTQVSGNTGNTQLVSPAGYTAFSDNKAQPQPTPDQYSNILQTQQHQQHLLQQQLLYQQQQQQLQQQQVQQQHQQQHHQHQQQMIAAQPKMAGEYMQVPQTQQYTQSPQMYSTSSQGQFQIPAMANGAQTSNSPPFSNSVVVEVGKSEQEMCPQRLLACGLTQPQFQEIFSRVQQRKKSYNRDKITHAALFGVIGYYHFKSKNDPLREQVKELLDNYNRQIAAANIPVYFTWCDNALRIYHL